MSRRSPREPGIGASLLVGLPLGVAMLVASHWLTEGTLKAAALTAALLWAVTTSFMSRWRDPRFWAVVATIMGFHVVMIRGVVGRLTDMGIESLLVIGVTEAIVMALIVMLFCGRQEQS